MTIELVLAGIAGAWVLAYLVFTYVFKWKTTNISLYPLFLIIRSRGVAGPLDRIAGLAPRLWDAVSRAATVVGVGLAAFAIYILSSNLATYILRPETVGPQNIVIPLIIGVTIRIEQIPYLLIAFGVVLLTHEGLHGIIARREGLPVKSAGIFLIFILPGGFVEPDEETFKKSPPGARMRVAAVGSFANLTVGFLVVLTMYGLFSPYEAGLFVVQTEEYSRIPVNEVVVSIDGLPVNSQTARGVNITLGETVTVSGVLNTYTFQIRPEAVGMSLPLGALIRSLGVTQVDSYVPLRWGVGEPATVYNFYKSLFCLELVSLGVAVFNMLPIQMLDGNIMLRAFLERHNVKRVAEASTIATAACLLLLASNIFMTYRFFGFFQL
ncbi:MAG: site-2 protease family protein [Nitrososphaerota archaeon]